MCVVSTRPRTHLSLSELPRDSGDAARWRHRTLSFLSAGHADGGNLDREVDRDLDDDKIRTYFAEDQLAMLKPALPQGGDAAGLPRFSSDPSGDFAAGAPHRLLTACTRSLVQPASRHLAAAGP
jgi:hypothetical protein